jgi:hypothetical protein
MNNTSSKRKIPIKLSVSVADNSNGSAMVSVRASEAINQSRDTIQQRLDKLLAQIKKPSGKTKRSEQKPRAIKTATNGAKVIEIHIVLPPLSSLHPKKIAKKFLTMSKRRQIGSAAVVILLIGLTITSLLVGRQDPNAAAAEKNEPVLTRGTPSFATVLPAGKKIDQLGGWAKISPPGRSPVYTYADSIDGVRIDVSEQPLPANFRSDTAEKIDELANGFGATDKVTVDDRLVYIGTSAAGPQSVITTKNNLLILIRSTSLISDSKWVAYIAALR